MIDLDKLYNEQHGTQEHPHEFRLRFIAGKLTESEQSATASAMTPENAFTILYPSYVSLDAFREANAHLLKEDAEA